MCLANTTIKCAIAFLSVYTITLKLSCVNTIDWHSCFITNAGIRTTTSMQKCQIQCHQTSMCTGVSYCKRTGLCHIVTIPLETNGVVNNMCPGCVVVYRADIHNKTQEIQENNELTEPIAIGCDTNIPYFSGCHIKGNMYSQDRKIKVHCNTIHYDCCLNSTYICDTTGAWTFTKCFTEIARMNSLSKWEPSSIPTGLFRNVAQGKTVQMSSQYAEFTPGGLMMDGVRSPYWPCACTRRENDPYMIIDSDNVYSIYSVYLINRYYCCPERLRDFDISFGETMATLFPRIHHTGAVDQDCYFILDSLVRARYVKIQINGYEYLTICEFEIYGYVVEL